MSFSKPFVLFTFVIFFSLSSSLLAADNNDEFALENENSLEQITPPPITAAITEQKRSFSRDQDIIRKNLQLFWRKLSIKENQEQDQEQKQEQESYHYPLKEDVIIDVARIDALKGHCNGLSMLWLYSKWLQSTQPEKTYGYTNDWFNMVVDDIASWDGQKELTDEQTKNFQRFSSLINYFQALQSLTAMQGSLLDTDGKIFIEKFSSDYRPITLEELIVLFKENISSGKMIRVSIIVPSGGLHANGIFKQGEYYCLYEPNDPNGEYKDTSVEEIAKIIFNRYRDFQNICKLKINVWDFEKEEIEGSKYSANEFMVTDLDIAINAGRLDFVEALLKAPGIDINYVNKYDGSKPLSTAIRKGNTKIVEALLKAPGVDINYVNKYDFTALDIAIYSDRLDFVEILLKVPGIVPNTLNNALQSAIRKGNTKTVEALLKAPGVDINYTDKYGFTALDIAIHNDRLDFVEILLKVPGIVPNTLNNALQSAIKTGNAKIVEALLKAQGIDINYIDKYGFTALDIAIHNDRLDLVEILLKVPGIVPNTLNNALQSAIRKGNTKIVEALLKAPGVDINYTDKYYGFTALDIAIYSDRLDFVEILLKVPGIIPNSLNNALQSAIRKGNTKIVEALLKAPGVDINYTNEYGNNALSLASFSGNHEIAKFLLTDYRISTISWLKYYLSRWL